MEYEFIKERLAPCGLHCGKCFAYVDGEIRQLSQKLKESLGNFDIYAQRFCDLLNEPVFEHYPEFKALLSYFTSGECHGCRNEKCKIFDQCNVRECHEKKGVDFCYECPEFPCNHTGFDKHLHERSVAINMKIKQIGVEKYYDEIKDKPRY